MGDAAELTIAGRSYRKRPYTKGGHGWVREVAPYAGLTTTHQAEVGAEFRDVLDEVARLTAERDAARADADRLRDALRESEGEHRKAKLCVSPPSGEPTEDGPR